MLFTRGPCHELSQFRSRDVGQVPDPNLAQPSLEPAQVAPVGGNRVGRQTLFDDHVLQVGLDAGICGDGHPYARTESSDTLSIPNASATAL